MAGILAGGIGGFLSIAGTVVSAVGTIASGQAQRQAADFQAAQYEQQAKEERAAAQQQGFEIAHNKKLALSRNQAIAASSGLSATDAGSLDLMGDIARYGTWQEQIAQYGGDSRAAGYNAQAGATRASGKAAQTASFIDAASTIAGGFGSFYTKYGSITSGSGGGSNVSLRYG